MTTLPVTVSIASRYQSKQQAKNLAHQSDTRRRREQSMPVALGPLTQNMDKTFSISGFQYGFDSSYQETADENLPKIKQLQNKKNKINQQRQHTPSFSSKAIKPMHSMPTGYEHIAPYIQEELPDGVQPSSFYGGAQAKILYQKIPLNSTSG